jgi:hypothetical protein
MAFWKFKLRKNFEFFVNLLACNLSGYNLRDFNLRVCVLKVSFFAFLSWVALFENQVLAAGAGITYQGRLLDPNGNPVLSTTVQFKLQLRTPGAEDCLLYEEVQTKNLAETDGIFSISIFDGSGARLDSSGYGLSQIFANKNTFTFQNGQCANGTSWTPNSTDGRRIQLSFNDGTFASGTWEPAPSIPINFIPMAIEAMQVGGYKKEQLVRLADGVSTTGTEFNNASWTELLALISGTTTQYVKAGSANFTAAPQWNGQPSGANDLVNKTYVDAQVAAGLPNIGTPGIYAKVTTDSKGRVTSGGTLVEADIPALSTAGKVSGSAIDAGTIGGSAAINSTGNLVTSATVQGGTVGATNLRVHNGGNYVQLAAPALSGILNLTLPAADGANGALMKTNGAGQLSFGALSAADVPNLDAGKITTGVLPVARGGTGSGSFGNQSVLVSNLTGSAVSSLNCVNGQVLKFDVSGYAVCGSDDTGAASQWTPAGSDIYFNTGKVGIGTSTPSQRMEILETLDTQTFAQVTNTNGGASTLSAFRASNGSDSLTMLMYGTGNGRYGKVMNIAPSGLEIQQMGATGDIFFKTQTTNERMRITAAGNVGIGTASPTRLLDIDRADAIPYFTYSFAATGPVPQNSIRLTNSSPTNSGNALLELRTTNSSGNLQNAYFGTVSSSGAGSFTPDVVIGTQTGANQYAERLRINSNGFLGIGGNLHINSANISSPLTAFSSIGNVYDPAVIGPPLASGVTSSATGVNDGSFATHNLRVYNGASTSQSAYIGAVSTSTGYTPIVVFGRQAGVNSVSESLRIDTNGNVGIGTTAPSAKLEVAGTAKVTGDIVSGSQTITGGTSTINWSNGNSISTDYNCNTNLTMNNLRDGGTYTLVVTEAGTTQCSFDTTTTGTDAATVSYRFKPANAARTATSHTVYTLMRIGLVVYVSWTSGF